MKKNKFISHPVILCLLVVFFGGVLGSWYDTWKSYHRSDKDFGKPSNNPPGLTNTLNQGIQTIPSTPMLDSVEVDSNLPTVTLQVQDKTDTQGTPISPAAVQLPAAFQHPEAIQKYDLQDQQDVMEIASNFTTTLQNSGFSPYSKEYNNLWRKALQESDDALRARLGTEAYQKLLMPQ